MKLLHRKVHKTSKKRTQNSLEYIKPMFRKYFIANFYKRKSEIEQKIRDLLQKCYIKNKNYFGLNNKKRK